MYSIIWYFNWYVSFEPCLSLLIVSGICIDNSSDILRSMGQYDCVFCHVLGVTALEGPAVANDETWNAQIIIFMHLLPFPWMVRVQFSTHFSWLLLGLGNKNLYAETYWKVVIIFLFWLNSRQERHAYWWRPLHVYSLSFFYFNLPGKEKSWQEWKFPLIYSYIF